MKKRVILLLLLVTLSLTACSSRKNVETNTSSGAAQTSNSSAKISAGSHKVLVVYFSRVGNTNFPNNVDVVSSASLNATKDGVQGNTEIVAKMIQKDMTGSNLFFIQTADKLPADYNATVKQGKDEHSNNARPKLAKHMENMNSYDVVFLVYPNWWYDMPMTVYSFLDEYDLSGKTIVPFCTSGGSGFSSSIKTIGNMEPKATILEGLAISEKLSNNTSDNVKNRLSKLGFIK
ncbi:flavodoxin [Clostridium sp. JS66]|uniref:flavodoxin n=1 Tax=Clostridium sp. JS66 TaxID=3064705 RepID=UPI00298ED012|nr:flavodoxin [Clostridium sp. JS66]WPC43758.1 flavodoxin [Clostridium sp. JS66]